MPNNRSCSSRRRFVKLSLLGLAASPLWSRTVIAQDKVTEEEPTAKALNYVHDGAQSEMRSDATQSCANCQLYVGTEDPEWGACAIFQNRLVRNTGWCSAWVLKAG